MGFITTKLFCNRGDDIICPTFRTTAKDAAFQRSSLLDFIALLREIFTREPPVVAKRRQTQSPISAQQHPGAQPPLPPKLENAARQTMNALPSNQQPAPPRPPPKPPKADGEISSKYDKPAPLPPQQIELERRYRDSLPLQTSEPTLKQPLANQSVPLHVRDPSWRQQGS